jgi:hypothetical protein
MLVSSMLATSDMVDEWFVEMKFVSIPGVKVRRKVSSIHSNSNKKMIQNSKFKV